MKLHELTPAVFLISSAESAEAFTLLAYSAEAVASAAKAGRSSSYGRSVRRIHLRAHTWGLLRRRIKARLRITTAGRGPSRSHVPPAKPEA